MKHAQKYRYFSLLMGLVLLLSAAKLGQPRRMTIKPPQKKQLLS